MYKTPLRDVVNRKSGECRKFKRGNCCGCAAAFENKMKSAGFLWPARHPRYSRIENNFTPRTDGS